ncbi:hypothetical protein Tco_0004907 [Tanacetum coccineum]
MPTEMELTLEQTQQGVSYEVSVLSDIEDSHGPSDAMHNPLPATQSQKDFVSKLTEIHSFLLTFSLRNIRVNSFTMKMEILLESTSNKLMVEHAEYDESNTYVLERFNTSAGNPVKKILLKLNLSDHRLCKMVVECQSVKVKEFQERCNIKAFQEWYEHVGPEVASPQGGKVTRWRRDCAWLMISRCSRSLCQIQVQGTSSIQEVNDHYNIFTRESQEYELKTKDKAYILHYASGFTLERSCTFWQQGKLNPRYVGPFKVLEKIRAIAYKLELPQELRRVHHTFHVSYLKKCYSDDPLVIPLDGLHIDDKLHFVEEPIEIMD